MRIDFACLLLLGVLLFESGVRSTLDGVGVLQSGAVAVGGKDSSVKGKSKNGCPVSTARHFRGIISGEMIKPKVVEKTTAMLSSSSGKVVSTVDDAFSEDWRVEERFEATSKAPYTTDAAVETPGCGEKVGDD